MAGPGTRCEQGAKRWQNHHRRTDWWPYIADIVWIMEPNDNPLVLVDGAGQSVGMRPTMTGPLEPKDNQPIRWMIVMTREGDAALGSWSWRWHIKRRHGTQWEIHGTQWETIANSTRTYWNRLEAHRAANAFVEAERGRR